MNTAPSTELEAINEMLAVIGESPVSTIDDNGVVDAAVARQTLNSISRAVQSKGWHFNTEKEMQIKPSFPSKELQLPLNVLRVDTVGEDQGRDLTQRGLRMYDRKNHTFTFDRAVKVDMIVMLPFDQLPEPARYYITIRAARVFQERRVGSDTLSRYTERDELFALITLQEFNGDTKDANILTDSYAVASILER